MQFYFLLGLLSIVQLGIERYFGFGFNKEKYSKLTFPYLQINMVQGIPSLLYLMGQTRSKHTFNKRWLQYTSPSSFGENNHYSIFGEREGEFKSFCPVLIQKYVVSSYEAVICMNRKSVYWGHQIAASNY